MTSYSAPSVQRKQDGKIAKTIGYYAVFVTVGLAGAALGPTLGDLAENTGTDLARISILFTAFSLGYLIGSLLGGRLYDAAPGHPVMAAMVLLAAVMMALTPLMPRLWLLAAVWLALGAASGGLDVGGNTLLVWVHGRQVGPFMNGLHFFFGVGAFLSPLLVALAASLGGGITWSYWTLALLALPAGAWLLRLASPPAPRDGEDGAAGPASPWLVALLALFLLLYVGAESAFGGWIYTYAVAQGLGGGAAAAYLTSAFWGSLTVGRLLTIPLAIRFRPLPILIVSLAGCLASAGAVLLWPDSLVAVWSATLGMGLGMAAIFPTTMALAERRMTITGRVTGWFLAASSLGGMSLPWLIGQLFEPVGPWIMAGIILVSMVAATAVLGIFTLRTGREAR